MARKVQVILVDDIDGSEAKRTVTFALDGKNYEIDLNETNLAALNDALAPYIEKARRVSGSGKRAGTRRATSGGDTAVVREWARGQGYEVSDRGRLPQEIRDAYSAAH